MTFHAYPMVAGERTEPVNKNFHPSYYGPVTEDNHRVVYGLIDPCLEPTNSSSDELKDHNGMDQMQRYLSEHHHALFQAPQAHDNQFSTAELDVIPPPPPRLQARHSSPFSQNQSSATSGIHSPRTESDLCYESTQGPSTPPDLTLLSPYMNNASYDHWERHSSQFSLAGIAFIPAGGCVNPSEINPSQSALQESHENESSMDFTLQRGSSFDSTTSSQYQETSPYQASFLHPEPKQPPIKSEIQAQFAQAPIYPDPENIDEDVRSPGEIIVRPASPDANDEDYKPNTRSRATRNSRNTPRRTRPKRASTSAPAGSRVFKNTLSTNDSSRRLLAISNGKSCVDCRMTFKDQAALQKHTKTQHTRPFICVFHYAGCGSTFATKNEWKRHVTAQHLALSYYLCTHDACGQTVSRHTQQVPSSAMNSFGRPFRRKDLFTQHARRMHTPASARKVGKTPGATTYEWEEKLREMQDQALRQRCHLPTYMRCPAQGCALEFRGENAWDERMEHVARHLERAANDDEPKVQFGGPNDETLTMWAASNGVNVVRRTLTGWELCSPLKDMKIDHNAMSTILHQSSPDEDAEGEEYFQ